MKIIRDKVQAMLDKVDRHMAVILSSPESEYDAKINTQPGNTTGNPGSGA
ncbi:MAG: hypothetical protein IBX40_12325 [Methanosarcinales archaeon]|nr:hypothetical protein [Methanosarcinales archaeon]